MEPIISNGDYVYDGAGGFTRAEGREALLRRCLVRLQAKRGGMLFMPHFGSTLHTLVGVRPADRAAFARAAAAEALADEPVSVRSVDITPSGDTEAALDFVIDYDDGEGGRLSLSAAL